MKFLQLIIILVLSSACQDKNEAASLIFEDCKYKKIDFTSGIELTDSLNLFSVLIPDSTWSSEIYLAGNSSTVVSGDSVGHGVSVISVTAGKFNPPWNQESEESHFLDKVEVWSKGSIKKMNWYEVYEGPESTKTVVVMTADDNTGILLTTVLRTTDTLNPEARICELE